MWNHTSSYPELRRASMGKPPHTDRTDLVNRPDSGSSWDPNQIPPTGEFNSKSCNGNDVVRLKKFPSSYGQQGQAPRGHLLGGRGEKKRERKGEKIRPRCRRGRGEKAGQGENTTRCDADHRSPQCTEDARSYYMRRGGTQG